MCCERVNDLIVPDATGGMFVTMVYAVLDLETGELDYRQRRAQPALVAAPQGLPARAVPARPAWRWASWKTTQFEERTCQIGKGDFLILYTDGVTDAFSAARRMILASSVCTRPSTMPANP